jgi:hypothetical protein
VRHEPRARDRRIEVYSHQGIVVVPATYVRSLEHIRDGPLRGLRLVFHGFRELDEQPRRAVRKRLEAGHRRVRRAGLHVVRDARGRGPGSRFLLWIGPAIAGGRNDGVRRRRVGGRGRGGGASRRRGGGRGRRFHIGRRCGGTLRDGTCGNEAQERDNQRLAPHEPHGESRARRAAPLQISEAHWQFARCERRQRRRPFAPGLVWISRPRPGRACRGSR